MLAAANATEASPKRADDGQARLRRIARAGKQWKKTIGRPVDMEGTAEYCISHRLCCSEWTWDSVRVSAGVGMGSTLGRRSRGDDPPTCPQRRAEPLIDYVFFMSLDGLFFLQLHFCSQDMRKVIGGEVDKMIVW